MKRTLEGFILDWNQSHKHLVFSLTKSPVVDRPINVEIRYPAVKYRNVFTTENWQKLNDMVDAKSHGTMFITSNEYLFERGVINASIASQNHNYEDQRIAGTLIWISENMFPE